MSTCETADDVNDRILKLNSRHLLGNRRIMYLTKFIELLVYKID